MPRKLLIRSSVHPYHVTVRTNNRETFILPLFSVWHLMNEQLHEAAQKHGALVHAFVLMPNHLHLLISTPQDDLGKMMQTFIRSITKIYNTKLKRTGRLFGSKYHWSLVDSIHYSDVVLKYIYRNPVRAGITEHIQDYSFTTIHALLDKHVLPYQLKPIIGQDDLIPFGDAISYTEWLNAPFYSEDELYIKMGLQKSVFAGVRRGWNFKKVNFSKSDYSINRSKDWMR